MVSGFRRSLSLPGQNPSASPARRRRHLRSTSLPCRSHPALSHLLDQIRSSPDHGPRSSAAGFDRIDRLLAAFDDLLRLPKAQDALRRSTAWAGRLLDSFLRLADAHGSFRSAAVDLGQDHSDARSAIRRRDSVRLASAARSHRRAEKELTRLASTIKDLARSSPATAGPWADAVEADVAGIVTEAVAAVAAESAATFSGIAAASSAVAASMTEGSWMVWPLRRPSKKGSGEAEMAAMEKVEELGECIEGLEEGSGRVFRGLVNARVSLLNILTPSLLRMEPSVNFAAK